MRNFTNLVKLECPECGAQFNTDEESKKHFHSANKICDEPLTYLLIVPSGTKLGTSDGVKAIATACKDLKQNNADKKFIILPYSYAGGSDNVGNYQYLESLIAVES